MELTMTNQPPQNWSPRRGRHWVVPSVAMPLASLRLGASLVANNGWRECASRAGAQPAGKNAHATSRLTQPARRNRELSLPYY
jgi:hypothetical protein